MQHKTGPRLSVSPFNHHKEFVMSTITSAIKTFIADEDGVTAIEYGLIAALIGVVMASVAGDVGTKIKDAFTYIKDQFADVPAAPAAGG
jgi:pilus assembly protein Flp/PilA